MDARAIRPINRSDFMVGVGEVQINWNLFLVDLMYQDFATVEFFPYTVVAVFGMHEFFVLLNIHAVTMRIIEILGRNSTLINL